jgi:predicted O-linked N-acetylglucosamine transferase (SPINDLY family)
MEPTPLERAIQHHQAGRLPEAIAEYRRALAADPRQASAYHNLGQALRGQNELAEAVPCFRKAIELAPTFAGARGALAEVLLGLGKAAESVPEFEQALVLVPADANLHAGLGDAWHAQGQLERAVRAYRRAVSLGPKLSRAWWGLGCACLTQGEFAAAASALEQLVQLLPASGEAWQNLGKALYKLGQIDPAIDACRRAADLLRPNDLPLGTIATIIPGSPRADNQAILDARRTWAAAALHSLAPPGPARAERGEFLRIGYVSSFFSDRNWMKPVWGLINHHDRSRFALHLFSDGPESRIQHGYRKDQRDQFHDISGLSNAQVAGLIEANQIDVVVDLNCYSQPSRLGIFMLRPAPVVVLWFSAFATSGLDCFDVTLVDENVIPAAEERCYSEPVQRLPLSYLSFEVNYPVPDVTLAPCLKRGYLTFGGMAPQYKITSQVAEAWSEILKGAPSSRLVLKNTVCASEENRRFVLGLFTRCGVAPERIDLEGPAEHYAFLEKYADIDVVLDTFPYNGGTTNMEALWQGVPVLAFPGDRWAARITASMLHYAGMPEFVAPHREAMVQQAIQLASDLATPALLARLRRGMREHLQQSSLCDVARLAREMEGQYERLWRAALR